jgi:hypothetical protein
LITKLNKRIANAIDNTWQTCADDFEENIGVPAIKCEILELVLDYLPQYAEKDEIEAWNTLSATDKMLSVQQFFGWDDFQTRRCRRCQTEHSCPYLELP